MEKIETAPKNVLVDIVKRSQKQGMRGANGSWKEYVNVSNKQLDNKLNNKQLDNRLYDPAKWLPDRLIEFLKTFNNASYLNYFAKVIERHEIVEAFKKSTDKLSPEQELFHKTVTHPHYATSYVLPSHKEGWVVIKNSKKLKEPECNTIYAVDCEMVLCDDGTDALVRVCVVDRDLKVKLDQLVKPDKRVVDYRTRITGIRARDLEKVTLNLRGVQAFMTKLLSEGAMLAGHSLDSDLRALKLDYTRVIDTSFIFDYSSGPIFRRASLNNLCKAVLGSQVRKEGAVHDCLDDTVYTMKLVVAKLDGKVDNVNINEVLNADAMKLFCHCISIDVSKEKLFEIIPGEYTIELKENVKGGNKYAAFLVFKSKREADEAYEKLVGDQDKDSKGRPQKRIGAFGTMYVRKMAPDSDVVNNNNNNNNNLRVVSNKRSFEHENTTPLKKLKTNEKKPEPKEKVVCDTCDRYLNEIETLRKQLSEHDQEVARLRAVVVFNAKKEFGF